MRLQHRSSIVKTALVITILIIMINPYLNDWFPYFQSAHADTVTVISVDPPVNASSSLRSGPVSFQLNVSNAPSINQFSVSLSYNFTVLLNPRIDFTNNALGSSAKIFVECIDGKLIAGFAPQCNTVVDFRGVISLSLFLFSASTTAPTNGHLFRVTFDINSTSTGYSDLHIIQAVVGTGNPGQAQNPPPVSTHDGYFTNRLCGSALCKPPVPGLTYSPSLPTTSEDVKFDASTSNVTNPGATVRNFTWTFSDDFQLHFNQTNRAFPRIAHRFGGACNCSVSLGMIDSYGIVAYKTIIVRIVFVFIELAITDLGGGPNHNVSPGTVVDLNMTVANPSTRYEVAKINATVRDLTLYTGSFNLSSDTHQTVGFQWKTDGYTPGVYQILGQVTPVPGQNVTSQDALAFYVQLIYPQINNSLSLGLFPSLGLGLVILLGGGIAASRFIASSARKRRAAQDAQV